MASLPPGKRPRTAAPCSFDESLDDLEAAVARISGAEPRSVSADQLRRLKELKHLLFRKEMEVDSLARAKKRARVAAEVVLPLDLLTHAFLPLDLKYLVAASQTCRHFKLAVSRAVTLRGNQIGLRQGDAEKLSLKTLAPLEEKAAQVRALMASIDQRSSQQQLIRLLSARSGGSREERALGPLLLCRHEAVLWARVEALVKKDAHRTPRAPDTFFEDLNFENGVADQANAYETYLDSLVPELDHLLSLLSGLTRRATRAADSALLVSHAPTLVQLVTASVDEKIACDAFSICRFRERVLENAPFTRAYLAADPHLGSFKRMLSLAGRENEPRRDNFHSVDPSPSRSLVSLVLIHALKALPKAALAPLHDELVRVGGDKRYEEQLRTTARELLIGLEFSGAASSPAAVPCSSPATRGSSSGLV